MADRSPQGRDRSVRSHREGRAPTPVTARPPDGYRSRRSLPKEQRISINKEIPKDDLDARLSQLTKDATQLTKVDPDASDDDDIDNEVDNDSLEA